jgi:hypothetical protein
VKVGTCGLAEVVSPKEALVGKSQIHKLQICKSQKGLGPQIAILKVPHLQKVCNSNKLFKPANLRIYDLQNFFADRPPLNVSLLMDSLYCSVKGVP